MLVNQSKRLLALGTLSATLFIAATPAGRSNPIPASTPTASPASGLIHLKRGLNLVDVDSLIDPSKPDLFLYIDLKGGEASTASTPETTDPLPSPSVGAASPTPSEALLATPTPLSSPTPAGDRSESLRAMYQAQRLAQQGRFTEAVDLIDGVLATDDSAAPLHALRGSLSFKLNDLAAAEASWERALELDPGMEDVRSALQWLRGKGRGGNL